MTSNWRRCDVIMLHESQSDISTMSCACWVTFYAKIRIDTQIMSHTTCNKSEEHENTFSACLSSEGAYMKSGHWIGTHIFTLYLYHFIYEILNGSNYQIRRPNLYLFFYMKLNNVHLHKVGKSPSFTIITRRLHRYSNMKCAVMAKRHGLAWTNFSKRFTRAYKEITAQEGNSD